MLFNSLEYLVAFLPIVLVVYFWLNKRKLVPVGKIWLVVASLFFYIFWIPKYGLIITLSVLGNYSLGFLLQQITGKKKYNIVLILGVALNLLALGWYKYTDFIVCNINEFFGFALPQPDIVLPLAISFFTFQQIAYLVDCSRGITKERKFLDYSLFVVFFPQLIAGPIVHHAEMMPQFSRLRAKFVNWDNIAAGVNLCLIGLFKKVVIADRLSPWVAQGFDCPIGLNLLASWASSLAYTFQIYYDFSGYTDMATGTALMLNIKLPQNFNSPYKSLNIRDFWSRWHMTLSRFLRDYLYIPLGGNRNGLATTCRNLFLTFLLGGIWHGAGWTFVIWGLLHGLAIMIHRLWMKTGRLVPQKLAWCVTFFFINVTWVFFRAETVSDALRILKGMVGYNGIVLPKSFKLEWLSAYGVKFSAVLFGFHNRDLAPPLLLACLLSCLYLANSTTLTENFKATKPRLAWAIVMAVTSFIYLGSPSEFIYFQF